MGETVQKHLDNANSVWHELAVTFGGPRRRTMICHILRYIVTATLVYYQETPQPAFAHSLGAPSEWKEFAPQRANGPVQSQTQARCQRGEQNWDRWNGSDQGRGNNTRAETMLLAQPGPFMTKAYTFPTIDQYLRERLMPVGRTIPNIVGIKRYENSIPAWTVGGDLFEYINFQQRHDIAARIQRALRLSNEFLEPLSPGAPFVTQSTITCNG